jgi:hypothetical protein
MKIKPLMALPIIIALVLGFAMQSFADKSTSSVKNKSSAEEIPHITNEAEYAEFVRKREGAGQSSSVKSASSSSSSSSQAKKRIQ